MIDVLENRKLAQDETTASNKLRELADSTDLITRQNVLVNPNVPPDVLIKLATEFPKQVFNNPAIDLLLLETPNLFSGTSANALCSLLKREVPHRMIEYAANCADERLKLAILMNPQTSHSVLARLSQSASYQIQEAKELHCNFINNKLTDNYKEFVNAKIQQEILEADQKYQEILSNINNFIKVYEYIPNSISYYSIQRIGYYKDYSHLSKVEIEKMADSGNWQELQLLGIKSNIPISILEKMFDNGNAYIYIASNPNLTTDLIRKLLALPDPRGSIASKIAFNPSTPVEILEELAKSNRHNAVHSAIAVNPKTPNKILEIILNRPTNHMMGYVYEALGRSKNISPNLLEQLINKSQDALIPVFNNPRTSKKIKIKLLNLFSRGHYSYSSKNFIENGIIIPISKYYPLEFVDNLDIPSEFLKICMEKILSQIDKSKKPRTNQEKKLRQKQLSTLQTTLQTIAFHPNMSPDSLKILLSSKERMIRDSAIANYTTPKYITEIWGMSFLETLKRNELKVLASRLYITEELLRELVNHKDISVSSSAARNPSASDEILEEWETSTYYKQGVLSLIMAKEQRWLNRWESSISASNRLTVLLNPETPVSILVKVSLPTSWLERYAIAQNPNTPFLIIKRLAEDGNRAVRAAAKASLENIRKKIIN